MDFEKLFENFSKKILYFGIVPLVILFLVNRFAYYLNIRFLVLITFFILISFIPGLGIISFIKIENMSLSVIFSFTILFGLGWSAILGFFLLFIPSFLPLVLLTLNCLIYIVGVIWGNLPEFFKLMNIKVTMNNLNYLFLILIILSIIQLILILMRKTPVWFEEWDFFKLAMRIGQGEGNITYQYAQPIEPESQIINYKYPLPVSQRTHSPALSILLSFAFFSYDDYNSLFSIWLLQSVTWISMILIVFEYIQKQYSKDIAIISTVLIIINPKLFRSVLYFTDTPVYMLFFFGFMYYITSVKILKTKITGFFVLSLSLIRPEGIFVSLIVLLVLYITRNIKKIKLFIQSNIYVVFLLFIMTVLSPFALYFFLNFLTIYNVGIWGKLSLIVKWFFERSLKESITTMFIGNQRRDGFILLLPTVLGVVLSSGLFYLGLIFKLINFEIEKDTIHLFMFVFGLFVIGFVPPQVTSAVRYGIIYYLPLYYIYVVYSIKFILNFEARNTSKFNYFNNIFEDFKNFKENPVKKEKLISFVLIFLLCISGLFGEMLFTEGPLYIKRLNQEDDIDRAAHYINTALQSSDVLGIYGLWTQPVSFNFGYIELGRANLTQLILNLSITMIWIGPNNEGNIPKEKENNWFIKGGKLKINETFMSSLRIFKKYIYIAQNYNNNVYLIKIIPFYSFDKIDTIDKNKK